VDRTPHTSSCASAAFVVPPSALAPRKNNGAKVALVAVLAVIVFFAGCTALAGLGGDKVDGASPSGSSAGIGSTVRRKVLIPGRRRRPRDDWYGDPKPLGQWVIATMAVTNTGNEPQSFFARNQKLIDTSGLGVRGRTMAASAMNGDDAMTVDLNPQPVCS
jgi:hypothetical protein